MSSFSHVGQPAGLRAALPAALLALAACMPFAPLRSHAQALAEQKPAEQKPAEQKPAEQGPAGSASEPVSVPAAPDNTAHAGANNVAQARPAISPVMINGRPYVKPTPKEQFHDYVRDSYGWPALARTSARALYAQGVGKPEEWGQDWEGFGHRFGSATATTVIDGNVRYGMEMLFKEDLRYIPCHGCSVKRKLENALLAEITARHDSDGHRFFTLTPTITDMTGPIIANAFWVPDHTAIDGFVGSRLIFATRIGGHLFSEFVLERRHHDAKLPD